MAEPLRDFTLRKTEIDDTEGFVVVLEDMKI